MAGHALISLSDLTELMFLCYNRYMDAITNTDASANPNIQVEAIRVLTREIPTNEFGMPTGVYRTDLLPFHNYVPNHHNHHVDVDVDLNTEEGVEHRALALPPEQQEPQPQEYRIAGFLSKELHGAFIPLQFDEGFPAFNNGLPFWSRFDFEPSDAFEAFQRYTQMNLGRLATSSEEEYDGKAASGTRSLSTLVAEMYPDTQVLDMVAQYQEYYHLYYWGMRAHAYDLYRVAQFRKQQEHRAVESQDEHYVLSRRLRHKLMSYFENDEDFMDMMTPKVALDMLKTLVGIERVSAGIPAGGPVNENTTDASGKPFEMVLRTVSNSNRRDDHATVNEEGEILDRALKSPEAVELLQELIIRHG